MAHDITAIIGGTKPIARIVEITGCPAPTGLSDGLLIAPLGHAQLDRLMDPFDGEHSDGFTYLCSRMEAVLSTAANDGALAYIETNYFGGAGSQAAALFADGKLVLKDCIPISRRSPLRDDPINKTLRALGVQASAGQDEFDTLGLGRYRDLESLGLDEWADDEG